jgi:hypothetical protein
MYVVSLFIECNLIEFFFGKLFRDQTPPTTPERVRTAAQQEERNQRVLDSPENRRTPHPAIVSNNHFVVPPVAAPSVPVYSHLPPHLAQALANLPPLNPPAQRGRRRHVTTSIPTLAPAFDLAQRVANLPPLNPPVQRGRRRQVTAPAVCFCFI